MMPYKWIPTTILIMIIGILGFVIVILLFFNDRIELVSTTESGIYVAISILVALFAALFIWTALKESDFKDHKNKIDELSKGMEEFKELASLNYSLFHVSSEGADTRDNFKDFSETLFKVVNSKRLKQKDILRISRILWQRDKLNEAFLIRKKAYLNSSCYYTALNYCSISNYMQNSELSDEICSVTKLTPLLKLLQKHQKDGYNDNGCSENRIWIIAGLRFMNASSNGDNNLLLALYCLLRAIAILPDEMYYHRNFILGTLVLKDINIQKIDYDIIRKLDAFDAPTQSNSKNELEQYILYKMLEYIGEDIGSFAPNTSSLDKLTYKYFEKWRDSLNLKESSSNYVVYKSFCILIEDIFEALNNISTFGLYDFFNFEIVAKQVSLSDIDKASIFNIYPLLEKKFGNNTKWSEIELLYLTFYYFMAVDDYSADKVLKDRMRSEVFNNIIPLWG